MNVMEFRSTKDTNFFKEFNSKPFSSEGTTLHRATTAGAHTSSSMTHSKPNKGHIIK